MNVPKIRFKEFDSTLSESKLGEICSFTQGIQIPSSEQSNYQQEGYIRYLYIRDFFSNDYPCYVKNAYPEKIIKEDEIMMVNTGNTAGMAYMGATGVLSNNCFKIGFDDSQINNKYLFNFLISEKTQQNIRNFFNAGGQPHLGHKNIAQISFNFPSFPEQIKIADFLSKINEKISQLTQKYELLNQYKKGVMQKIFSRELRFKDEGGAEFPEWEETTLGDIAKFYRGGSLAKSDIIEDGKYECIHYGELFTIYREVIKSVYSRTNKTISVKSEFGDILMPSSDVTPAGLAKASCLLKAGVALGGDTNIIRLKSSLSPVFISYLLNSEKNKVIQLVSGTTVKHIYIKDIKSIGLIIPISIKEQTKIANFLISIDEKITLIQSQLELVKQYKQGLLQQMFI